MMTREERVRLLCKISREIEKRGPMYLAILLVQETYARETLQEIVFGKGDLDGALLATVARLERMVIDSTPPAAKSLTRRQERSRRRLRGLEDLGERLKLREAGEPLPDTRRSKKAA